EFGGTSGYIIVTPLAGWSFIPMRSETAKVISEETLKGMQSDMDIAGPLIDYAAKGYKVELAGKENIDGKDAYKIKLTLNTGNEIIYFLDTKTYLLIQAKQARAGMDDNTGEREVVTNYADYYPVDGILFPGTISNPGNDPGSGTITFNKIELNKTIEESQFKPSV
ncbi:MAG: hypothetical protein ABIN93_16200, partial [Ginsengibacter sp.]